MTADSLAAPEASSTLSYFASLQRGGNGEHGLVQGGEKTSKHGSGRYSDH